MTVSVLIPWRESDPRRRRNLEWVEARWRAIVPSVRVLWGSSPDGPFNRAAAINNARKQLDTSTNVIIVGDADTSIQASAIQEAIAIASKGRNAPWLIPYTRYYNLTDACSERVMARIPGEDMSEGTFDYEHLITFPPKGQYAEPVSGVLVIPVAAFDLVGGFDSTYVGWGFEDRDMCNRLDKEWGNHQRLDSFVFHLWHPVAGDPFKTPECEANRERYKRTWGWI